VAHAEQTYANHARLFPPYHYFVLPVLALNVLWALWQVVRAPSLVTLWGVVVAAALATLATVARVMVLVVQDRVIRLEMRLRLREVLPPDLQSRIQEIGRAQLVGLRFASDAELPDLVRQVLAGSLKTSADIKKAVRQWRPDELRA
jgi:hypothetical protein